MQRNEQDGNIFCTIQAFIPSSYENRIRDSNPRVSLVYTYILNDDSNSSSPIYHENLLLKHKQLRSLNSLIKNSSGRGSGISSSRRGGEAVMAMAMARQTDTPGTIDENLTAMSEKIDGVVLFGELDIYNQNSYIRELNKSLVRQLVVPDFFDPKLSKYLSETNNDLKSIHAAHESICKDDNIRQLFNIVNFVEILAVYKTKKVFYIFFSLNKAISRGYKIELAEVSVSCERSNSFQRGADTSTENVSFRFFV